MKAFREEKYVTVDGDGNINPVSYTHLITPARICGIDERVGSIKPGKDADLIIWDGKPMSISFKPRTVFCGGKIINQ